LGIDFIYCSIFAGSLPSAVGIFVAVLANVSETLQIFVEILSSVLGISFEILQIFFESLPPDQKNLD